MRTRVPLLLITAPVHRRLLSRHHRLFSTTTTTAAADMPEPKPSLPEDYQVPEVWTFQEQEGKMGAMNRPTAGARSEKELPKGDFDLQLYSMGTPNGVKVTILLEELAALKGVEYDAWKISIFDLDQFGSGFVAVNPNSKIPAMLDYGYDSPVRVFESGAILKYIAEKYDAFIPKDHAKKTETFNWLMWQMGTAPYIGGGFGHFYNYAPVHIQYAIDRFTMEVKRELDVLDKELATKTYIVGDEYTIADMAIWPWIMCCIKFYKAETFLQLQDYKNLMRWYNAIADRPAVKKGCRVNAFGDDAIPEVHGSVDKMDGVPK